MSESKHKIESILLQFKLSNKTLDESVEAIFSSLNVCQECGYPKIKKTFENSGECVCTLDDV